MLFVNGNGIGSSSSHLCGEEHFVDLGNLSEPRIQMSAALEVCEIVWQSADREALERILLQAQDIPFPRNGKSFPIGMVTRTIQYRLGEIMGKPSEQDITIYHNELSLLRTEIDRVDLEIVGSLSRKPDPNIDWGSQNFIEEQRVGKCLEGRLLVTSKTLEFLAYRWKIVRHIGQLKKQYNITEPVDEVRKREMIDQIIFGSEDSQLIRILTALFNYIHEVSVGIQRGVMKEQL